MLILNSKKVLDYCISNPGIIHNSNELELNLNTQQIRSACEFLNDKSCIKIINRNLLMDIQFQLTYKGAEYKTFASLWLFAFLSKSVLVPIVVTLITAAVSSNVGWLKGTQDNKPINVRIIQTPSQATPITPAEQTMPISTNSISPINTASLIS